MYVCVALSLFKFVYLYHSHSLIVPMCVYIHTYHPLIYHTQLPPTQPLQRSVIPILKHSASSSLSPPTNHLNILLCSPSHSISRQLSSTFHYPPPHPPHPTYTSPHLYPTPPHTHRLQTNNALDGIVATDLGQMVGSLTSDNELWLSLVLRRESVQNLTSGVRARVT